MKDPSEPREKKQRDNLGWQQQNTAQILLLVNTQEGTVNKKGSR